MTLLAETFSHAAASRRAPDAGAGFEFSFPYRQFETSRASRRPLRLTVTLTPGAGHPAAPSVAAPSPSETASLRAATAFLIDAAYGTAPAVTLVRMIGHYFFASGTAESGTDSVTVSLASTGGGRATALVERREFEIEHTAFGAAHILHEDDTLGLYILEIAPHGTIPAHCHRVMRESELILDDGLLQQGQPVAPGSAFAWPLGHVHAYRNPTGQPLRILCVDSPRFMPEDEVPLAAVPRLVPLAPLVNYLERIPP